MVLDDQTGQVVNLDVFAARTRLRAHHPLPSNVSSGHRASPKQYKDNTACAGGQKRKNRSVEGGDDARKKLRR
jgi:hypothetical protein